MFSTRKDYRSLPESETEPNKSTLRGSSWRLLSAPSARRLALAVVLASVAIATVYAGKGYLKWEKYERSRDLVDWVDFDVEDSNPRSEKLGLYTAQSTLAERLFPTPCLEQWIMHGKICPAFMCSYEDISPCPLDAKLDVVWTWVNASSKYWSDAKDSVYRSNPAFKQQIGASAIKHFRTHNELKYSLRSVAKAVENSGKFHILSTDLPSSDNRTRYGMVPDWLDISHPDKIQMQFPWNTFKTAALPDVATANEWREKALPTFQSHSIESTFPFLAEVSDTWVYMCDDFFVMQPLKTADLYSPLFGFTFRVQRDLTVPSKVCPLIIELIMLRLTGKRTVSS